jgi:BMFP domain-containing protein YqiC
VQFLQLSILSARLAALEARLAWQPSETDEDGSRSLAGV